MNDTWVSAHLFYQGDLDRLVTAVVRPVLADAAELSPQRQYFFLRYWESGPHLRLRVRARSEPDAEVIRSAIRSRAESLFSRQPSESRMLSEEYREIRRQAMRWEPWACFSAELSATDSVSFLPYDPEHHQYGRGPSLHAVERHFAESSEIALAALEAGMARSERELLAFCLLVLSWSAGSADDTVLAGWARTGNSWFESALSFDPQQVLADHVHQREKFGALARHLLQRNRQTAAKPSLRQQWDQSVTALRDRLVEAGTDPFAVLDRCGHLVCNRLGLSLAQESAVRTVACQAVLDALESR